MSSTASGRLDVADCASRVAFWTRPAAGPPPRSLLDEGRLVALLMAEGAVVAR